MMRRRFRSSVFRSFLWQPLLPAFCRSRDHGDATDGDGLRGDQTLPAGLIPDRRQAARQSHSVISAITSPNNNSAAELIRVPKGRTAATAIRIIRYGAAKSPKRN